MGRLLSKIIGLVLLVAGIYFLSRNIFFSTHSRYFWRSLPAAGSVLCLISGVISLVYFRRQSAPLGWVLLGVGIVLVFLSGGVVLHATSLWNFLVAFASMTMGFKLLTESRI